MQQPTADVAARANAIYRVGDLVVDTARAVVTRDGVELNVPRLSFDLLVALIEAAPRIVSLDELLDKVWAGVIVSPETVSQRVKLLRDALGDDSRAPRYVTAVRGRGYRLVVDVQRLADADATNGSGAEHEPATAAPASVTSQHRGPRWKILLSFGLLGAAMLVAAMLAIRSGTPDTSRATPGASGPMAEKSIAVLPFESRGDARGGDVLAFGIAEAVLHQLANVQGLVVIARTSSFALGAEPGDAREVGRRLDVRYLLEGSVQQDAGRLRVTAQLIDTRTGAHVWSLRFDEARTDIFAVQDGIASQVTQALQVSLASDDAARIAGQGTRNFDAYLAYMQGRALLASGSLSDATRAVESFQRAVQLDPAFPAAYVSLAEAEVFIAEFDAEEDRTQRFESVRQRALGLVAKAIALDAQDGPAYRMRGYLEAFTDLAAAEASYREGLRLRPNDAAGYSGLAAVLFEQPSRRRIALQMIDRARRLNPLEPAHDITKAVFLFYDRGDVAGAEALLRDVLKRQPNYLPALLRLGELEWCCKADAAAAIELLEHAVALDPRAHWPRRALVRAYLDVGEVQAALDVATSAQSAREVLRLPVLAYRGDWLAAGEAAYAALDRQLVTPLDEIVVVLAIRRHARLTGDHERAIRAFVALSGMTWSAAGVPDVPERPGLRAASMGLADMLQVSGDATSAGTLRNVLIARMGAELRDPDRRATWYYFGMSTLLALDGQRDAALDWLQRGVDARILAHDDAFILGADPAYDGLRRDPRFAALRQRVAEVRAQEQDRLATLRQSGAVPKRD